ncbi:MAG TPA: portal protein [Phycisphaerae bacterium]|nr:portal protein [Phycisphaerae bacterium]
MTLKQEFERADSDRYPWLARAREAAMLTIPTAMPQAGLTPGQEIERPIHDLGAHGVTSLVNSVLTAMFPAEIWFRKVAHADMQREAILRKDLADGFRNWLFAREYAMNCRMETTQYRPKMRSLLEQLLICGNSLFRVQDDYRLRIFRFDQFVWRRDVTGSVRRIITKEQINPLWLTDEQLALADVKRDELPGESDYRAWARPKWHLYTKDALQEDGSWLIQQELNKRIINESVETVNPYVPVGFLEMPGEDYSRGFVEEWFGSLRSANALEKAINDGMTALAKLLIAVDPASQYSPKDLELPNGKIITGRVTDGKVDGIAFLTTDKARDFTVAKAHLDDIGKRLGRVMMIESATQPTGDRVTATQIMRLATELQSVLGGTYTQIADEIQIPYVKRIEHQMERDGLLEPMPSKLADFVHIEILTGLSSLGRQADLDRALMILQMVKEIPNGLRRLDERWFIETIVQATSTRSELALRPEAEVQEEIAKEIEQQLLMQAGQQAIATAGKVAEQAAARETA